MSLTFSVRLGWSKGEQRIPGWRSCEKTGNEEQKAQTSRRWAWLLGCAGPRQRGLGLHHFLLVNKGLLVLEVGRAVPTLKCPPRSLLMPLPSSCSSILSFVSHSVAVIWILKKKKLYVCSVKLLMGKIKLFTLMLFNFVYCLFVLNDVHVFHRALYSLKNIA